jgi:hypothetical protein
VDAAREREQEAEGVLGEVHAHAALLARERHIVVDQLRAQHRVDAGPDGLVELEAPRERIDVGRHAPEENVGVHDLRALLRGIPCLDDVRARRRGENPRALGRRELAHDEVRRVEDLHQ